MNLFDSVTITRIGVEACSKVIKGLLKALQHRNKMFQNFKKLVFLKKIESTYSPIAQQSIDTDK